MKRYLILIYFLVIVVFGISARDVIPFNEGWKFRKGPFSNDQIVFQDELKKYWEDISIPHTWNNIDMQTKNDMLTEISPFYAGVAFYKKKYNPDVSLKDKRFFLRFEGVAIKADLYINGLVAGRHKGGYSAFAIEITKLLKFGEENEILIKVDNSSDPEVIPINHRLFGVYGGIYRPVNLIITEKVNIAVTDYASPGIYISQTNVNSKSADVNVKVKLENKLGSPKEIKLVSTIYEMDGRVKMKKESDIRLHPQGRQIFEQDFNIKNPHLWQGLEDPYLYKVETQVVSDGKLVDKVIQPLGLRHFDLRIGEGMYLNGKKIPMYGVCRHQDWWEYGSALTNEQHDIDMAIIKEIGATTVRLAHYQQADYIYSKCDSLGLLVWAEIPFVNRVSTYEADNAKQQMIELIRQNYNHPSIYTWGLHNEVDGYGYDERELYTKEDTFNPTNTLTVELHDLAKSEDPNRYTVTANGYFDPGHSVNMNADIQGINRYFGWYQGKIQDLEPWIENIENNYSDYRIMLSEYGAEANIFQQQEEAGDIGDCCGFSKNYNETFATRFHEIQWGYISKHPFLLASYVWNTFDFATPVMTQGGVAARNMKGLVTFDRKVKKDPFFWYKANWSKEPVLHITQRRVTLRKKKITPVTVYSNIGEPHLYINGQEVKSYVKGTTDVHYIFENVELKEGVNDIATKIDYNGKVYEDSIEWFYDNSLEEYSTPAEIKERKEEHSGL